MGRDLIDPFPIEGHRAFQKDIPGRGAALDLSFPGHQAGDGPQGGGFPGPVGADQADQFPRVHTQAQVIDEHGLFVTHRQMFDFQQHRLPVFPIVLINSEME